MARAFLLYGTAAADEDQPAGLLHCVTPIAAAATGPDAMAEDFGALTGAIGEAGIDPTEAVFVCSPREATIMKIKVGPKFDYPVLSTLGLPAKTVACFAPAAVASGYQDATQIETSNTKIGAGGRLAMFGMPDGRDAGQIQLQSTLEQLQRRARRGRALE